MHRIYVVADDPAQRLELEQALRRENNVVGTCGVGDFHAAQLREFEPDVVLVDLSANGATAPVRLALLRDPELKHVPLVALASTADEARAFGAYAYVPRGLPSEAVPELLDMLLRPLQPPLP